MMATAFGAASANTTSQLDEDDSLSEGLPAMIHGYVRVIKGLRILPLEGVEVRVSQLGTGEGDTDKTNADGHYVIDNNIKRFKWYSVSINVDREDIFPLGRLYLRFTAKSVTVVNAVFFYIGNVVVLTETEVVQSIQNQQSSPTNI